MNRLWSCDANRGKSPYTGRRHTAHIKCEFDWFGKKSEARALVPLSGNYEKDCNTLRDKVRLITEFLNTHQIEF